MVKDRANLKVKVKVKDRAKVRAKVKVRDRANLKPKVKDRAKVTNQAKTPLVRDNKAVVAHLIPQLLF